MATKSNDLRTPEGSDTAEALLHTMEHGIIRNGKVISTEQVVVPEEFYDAVLELSIEQLFLARGGMDAYPHTAANSLVERLIRDGAIHRMDAVRVRNMMELEIKRSLDRLTHGARDRLSVQMPIALRPLITLISRRRSTQQ